MKHVLLPHGPYLFLPSGKQTRRGFRDPLPGMNSAEGFGSPFLTDHNQQRLLLQIGYVDRELGKLFARMIAQGIFDQSLIVLTADHGISFEVGVKDRRIVNRANIDEVAPVPLFVKAPGQRVGRTDSAYAATIDIVPTMADVLNVRMPYRADGRSAFSSFVRGRRDRADEAARVRRLGGDLGAPARGSATRAGQTKEQAVRLGRHPHPLHGHRALPPAAGARSGRPVAGAARGASARRWSGPARWGR